MWPRLSRARGDNARLPGGLVVYGTGETRYFRAAGGGFVSPAADFGTLAAADGGFVYRSQYGERWEFDADGKLLRVVGRHDLATVYSYSGEDLVGVTTVDGNTVAVTGGGQVVFAESGGRTVTLTVESMCDTTQDMVFRQLTGRLPSWQVPASMPAAAS